MSTQTFVQNEQHSNGLWSGLSPYLTSPIAAGIAVIPVYYGFVAKSAKQVGLPIPKMALMELLAKSVKASPTVSTIVGTQMVAQSTLEDAQIKWGSKKDQNNFASMLCSAILVAVISAPPLAVFNGQTLNRTAMQSLKFLNAKQVGAIVTRETSFLFSLRISDPLSQGMKQISGDNKATEYASTFASGAIGSLIGHPADTAFTLWQKNIKVENLSQIMRGSLIKAMTVGCFAIIYNIAKKNLESKS